MNMQCVYPDWEIKYGEKESNIKKKLGAIWVVVKKLHCIVMR